MKNYLEKFGLKHHPFEPLESGGDKQLFSRLVDHPAYEKLVERGNTVVSGVPGSGRTAMAQRLAYGCRIDQDNRGAFYVGLSDSELSELGIEAAVERAAAAEALLGLAYKPSQLEALSQPEKISLVSAVEAARPGLLAYFLPQIKQAGSHLPVAETFCLPAVGLPNRPDSQRVTRVAEQIQRILDIGVNTSAGPGILEAVSQTLGPKEMMIAADFSQAPPPSEITDGLLAVAAAQTAPTSVKMFIRGDSPGEATVAAGEELRLEWQPDQLVNLLELRLGVASGGEFSNLAAISYMSDVEEKIVEIAGKGATPRDVLALAGYLLETHQRSGKERIIPDMLDEAAREWKRP